MNSDSRKKIACRQCDKQCKVTLNLENLELIARHHHLTVPALGTSTALLYALEPGGEPASATETRINASCGGRRFESALRSEALSWRVPCQQPQHCCTKDCLEVNLSA